MHFYFDSIFGFSALEDTWNKPTAMTSSEKKAAERFTNQLLIDSKVNIGK